MLARAAISRSRRYDVVHAFRLATAPEAESVEAEMRHIDLDEVDSATHRKLAALYRAHGAGGLCGSTFV